MKKEFKPRWLLKNRHVQTILPWILSKAMPIPYRIEKVDTPDGDFVELHIVGDQPRILLIHGLMGNRESHYISRVARTFYDRSISFAVFHFRGCGLESNKTRRFQNAGESADISTALKHMSDRYGKCRLCVGFSLGGNALLKYLGEKGADALCEKALAFSPPLRLADCAINLHKNSAKLYKKYLLNSCKKAIANSPHKYGINSLELAKIADFWTFDDQITAPVHGYDNVHHYYESCSSIHFLTSIQISTEVYIAKDDPVVGKIEGLDKLAGQSNVQIFESEYGGHVGFIDLSRRGVHYFSDEIILQSIED